RARPCRRPAGGAAPLGAGRAPALGPAAPAGRPRRASRADRTSRRRGRGLGYDPRMKSGRVIGGDEHDARTLAQQIVDEARRDAERITADARAEAERAVAAAQSESMKLRDDARVLANELVRGARDTGKQAALTTEA